MNFWRENPQIRLQRFIEGAFNNGFSSELKLNINQSIHSPFNLTYQMRHQILTV